MVHGINDGGSGGVSRRERFLFAHLRHHDPLVPGAAGSMAVCYDGYVRIISGQAVPVRTLEAGNAIKDSKLAEIPITRF